eukprot:6226057-Amphidinium_carterae.1
MESGEADATPTPQCDQPAEKKVVHTNTVQDSTKVLEQIQEERIGRHYFVGFSIIWVYTKALETYGFSVVLCGIGCRLFFLGYLFKFSARTCNCDSGPRLHPHAAVNVEHGQANCEDRAPQKWSELKAKDVRMFNGNS